MTARTFLALLAAGLAVGMAAAGAKAATGLTVSVGSQVTCRTDQKPVYKGHIVPFRGPLPHSRPSRFYGWFTCEPDDNNGLQPPVFPAINPIDGKARTACTVCMPAD